MQKLDVDGYAGTTTVRIEEFTVQCPYDDVTDVYTIILEWQADGEAPEFQSLREFIDGFEGEEIGQEQLATALRGGLPFSDVSVTVVGEQYGMDVRVESGGTTDASPTAEFCGDLSDHLLDTNTVRTAGVFSDDVVSIGDGGQVFALDSIRSGLDLLDEGYAELTVHTVPTGDGNEILVFKPEDDDRVVCVAPRVPHEE